jgi:hypothetical protein
MLAHSGPVPIPGDNHEAGQGSGSGSGEGRGRGRAAVSMVEEMDGYIAMSVPARLQPVPRVLEGVTSFAAQSFAKVSPPGTIWSSSKY